MISGMEIPILFSIKECVNQLTSAQDIFNMYSNTRLTCKHLELHFTNDISKFLKINDVKTELFVKVFSALVDFQFKQDFSLIHSIKENISLVLSKRMRQLITEKKVAELFELIVDFEPKKSLVKRVNLEVLTAKVINKDYCYCVGDDEMITQLALECANLDARATAQIFHQIPFIYLLNGEAIGKECAKNDPLSTLEYIDNFKKRLYGFHKTSHVNNIIKEANRHLNPNIQDGS